MPLLAAPKTARRPVSHGKGDAMVSTRRPSGLTFLGKVAVRAGKSRKCFRCIARSLRRTVRASHTRSRHALLCFIGAFLTSGCLLLSTLPTIGQAQVTTTITPDGTLGTTVTRSGPVVGINGGTRHGPNLFHSFDRFSVGTGEMASFTSTQTGIRNILSRVTGGQRSDIDGQLRTDGLLRTEGAHLYLLNPAGVLFGPNASLDVRGSLYVSTADYLRLADEARFSARLSQTSTLSMAPPVAFGFLGPQPAGITISGSTLTVPPGATLAVIGGDIQITGGRVLPTLGAPSGQIHLVSLQAAGEVGLNTPAPAPLSRWTTLSAWARSRSRREPSSTSAIL